MGARLRGASARFRQQFEEAGEGGLLLAANSDEDAARVQELIGACETIVVESGHDIHYDHPEAFVEAINRVAGNN